MNIENIEWRVKKFENLSVNELYDMMHLRQVVFVVEQDCPYIDADHKDEKSLHVNGYFEDKLVAHSRIVFPGISYAEASIGRVVSDPKYRATGLGQQLMKESIKALESNFGTACRISAQTYLIGFYTKFGFEISSEEYLEDDLPHIQMYRK